jgi:hypothetical protein
MKAAQKAGVAAELKLLLDHFFEMQQLPLIG